MFHFLLGTWRIELFLSLGANIGVAEIVFLLSTNVQYLWNE